MARTTHVIPWALQAFIVLCYLVENQQAAKILFLPSLDYSHCKYMNALGQELVQRGHEVAMYMCQEINFRDCPGPHFEVINFSWPTYEKSLDFKKKIGEYIFHGEWNVLSEEATEVKELMCEMIQQDDDALQRLHYKTFDLVVIDSLFSTQCFYLIPYNLSIPFISVSSALREFETGSIIAPRFNPNVYTSFNTEMNFRKRLLSTVRYVAQHMGDIFSVPIENFKLAPTLTASDVEDLYWKSELFLDNTDIIFDYPKPFSPHFRQVGGLTTRPGKPLSKSLQRFFDGATHGVIIMSFGNAFENITDKISALLLSSLRRLPQRILVKTNIDKVDGNVKMMTWFSLNDVCAHPNTKLLISHCDSNDYFESLYHGVPLICLPIVGDQFQIASRIEYYKMGLNLNIWKQKHDTLYIAALNVTTRPIYRKNAQKYSAVFRNRRLNPRQVAADGVEEVLQFGSRPLKGSYLHYPWYQLLNLDVWLFIHLLFLFGMYLFFCTVNQLIRWLQYYKVFHVIVLVVLLLYIHNVVYPPPLVYDI